MKTIYMGSETWTDQEGKERKVEVISRQFDAMDKKGWRRAILTDLMEVIEQIGNKKIKVMEYLIENMNANNEINLTQDEVVAALKISKPTVNATFQALVDAKLMKKGKRRYVMNTQIISAYGSSEKNRSLCIEYGFYSKNNIKTLEDDLIEAREKQIDYKNSEIEIEKILKKRKDREEKEVKKPKKKIAKKKDTTTQRVV